MIIIGLTGPSGAGKSACGRVFAAEGFFHIDADRVYKALCAESEEMKAAVFAAFPEARSSFGAIDFAALSASVFKDSEKLKLLGELTHPFVLARIRGIIREKSEAGWRGAVVDAAALLESGFAAECDIVVAVLCDRSVRIERITARDGIGRDAAALRVDAQKPDSYYSKNADIVIDNSAGEDALPAQVKKAIELALQARERKAALR